MEFRHRLAILLAGLVAFGFVAWPGFSIDRNGEWRTVLSGFQLHRETGDFIGMTRALIHFHGLGDRAGQVRFTLVPRIPADRTEVTVTTPTAVRHVSLETEPVHIELPLNGSGDLEAEVQATTASNPRPLRLSSLRITREPSLRSIVLAFLPLLLGILAFSGLARYEPSQATGGIAVFVIAAAAVMVVVACDPVRTLSFPPSLGGPVSVGLALGFAVVGVMGNGPIAAAIAFLGATVSLHVQTVHSGFVYDDRLWARPWTLAELASTFVGSEDPRGISGEHYRPIPSITHALDHALWGPSPFAYHGVNMVLHALAAFLLFVLLKRVCLGRAPAFLGALTLAIHPLAASSIGWISERTDTLADIFILATLITFVGPSGPRTLRVLFVALLALWSKETAVMLPILAAMFAFASLDAGQRRARLATLRALFGLVALYVVVWVSLFPEKAVGRIEVTAAALRSEQGGWMSLFGNLFSQLFHPAGFETWRAARETATGFLWIAFALLLAIASVAFSFLDRPRALSWRLVGLGLTFSALVVLPFRGHDAVDVYRLGHTPTIGFAILTAGLASLLAGASRWRSLALASLLILRFGPVSRETSAAWGYPGFQFRMALRFNLENPVFLGGLSEEMKRDLERESRFEAHRDNPLDVRFEP